VRVIHVTHTADGYGIGTMLESLLRYESKGGEVTPAVGYHISGPRLEQVASLGIPVYILGAPRDPRLMVQAIRVFRKYEVIVFHTHSPLAILGALLWRRPSVFVFHGATGAGGALPDAALRSFYRHVILRRCASVVFASQTSIGMFRAGLGFDPVAAHVAVFPFGLDLERIGVNRRRSEMRQAFAPDGQMLIGTAARLDPVKRIERLIEAAACVRDDVKLRVLVMGSGRETYGASLRLLASTLGVDVVFLGFREDVLDIVAGLDLFVLPSCGEALGLALVEAMALGVPCGVFCDAGGPRDVIGEAGIVARDPSELASAIVRLQRDRSWAAELSVRARRRAEEFDARVSAGRFAEVYRAALSQRSVR
jgi:glycosyltransferase involved in cell wall biosynthesis